MDLIYQNLVNFLNNWHNSIDKKKRLEKYIKQSIAFQTGLAKIWFDFFFNILILKINK